MIVLCCQVKLVAPSSDRGTPCNTNFIDFVTVTLWKRTQGFLDIYMSVY